MYHVPVTGSALVDRERPDQERARVVALKPTVGTLPASFAVNISANGIRL